MKTLSEQLKSWDACSNGYEWATNNCQTLSEIWEKCERGDWLIWLLQKQGWTDTPQIVTVAATLAEHVLPLFEQQYPEDKRPRNAINAARAWAANPTKENRDAAWADRAAAWAARAAAWADRAAAWADRAAAWAAAGDAACAARAAAWAAARDAAWAAAGDAACAARAAAWAAAGDAACAARAAAWAAARDAAWDAERKWQADAIRKIVPNPFEGCAK